MPVKANRKDPHIHKHAYAYLFAKREFVEYLIKSFVSEKLYRELDFSRFESNTEKTYLTDSFRDYESDMVIKVGWRDTEIYIYLLMEFQSTTEEYMPLRFLNYWTLFHMDASVDRRKRKLKDGKLPPTLPILIYSGKEKWKASHEIRDLIQGCEFIDEYTPSFKYFPVIINTFSRRSLVKIRNAVSALFLCENSLSEEEMADNIGTIADIIREEKPEVALLFNVWFKHILQNQRIDSTIYTEVEDVVEKDDTDMYETVKIWERDIQSRAEVKGEAKSLLRILRHRFGDVPEDLENRILTVNDGSILEAAIDVALDAGSIEDLIRFLEK